MSENPWNTPEAVAYFESEYAFAIKNAKPALVKACAQGGALEKMCGLPYALYGELNTELGAENSQALFDLIMAAPMVREFLEKGETGKL